MEEIYNELNQSQKPKVKSVTNIHALHSSGCLKGKARPLSIAAILMQESGLFSGHSASYREVAKRVRQHSTFNWVTY